MINQFKAVIQNKNLYREIEIPFDNVLYSIGTGIECNYRLRKELFFEDIRLDFINNNNNWSVMCSDNLYITVGDARKLLTKQIRHGEKMIIKYQQSNNNVFELEFKVDFAVVPNARTHSRYIDLYQHIYFYSDQLNCSFLHPLIYCINQ